MKDPITQNLIAPCGMNCGICKGHLREKNRCPGCNNIQKNKSLPRLNCRLRTCPKRTGKFCYHCPEFPCARLRHLDKRYRTKYAMSEIENLESIKKNGIRKFVASERKRWLSDQGVFCVHDRKHYK